ncbi:efflux RND transporter periplasmic adaptor subunit [uncultured Cytophaga sp.]|uniref:efflux RND transporter periplasmic adaptor subunit n=1 Tax=uncultured Cytophaga sp. TaxID=160238 RepID=UPI002622DDC0|nr:efflux RND transporter periplasmic adaptor subunit [uncultured Cytophaga sp.]
MKKLLILLSLALLLCETSCEEHVKEKEKIKFLVTSPIRMDTSTTKEYVCQIKAIRHIELRALERGYLQDYFIDEGKFVKQGTLMFQILPVLYQADQQKALAEMNFAEIEYLNTKALADSNVVSKNELLMAKAKFERAKAELNLAQAHLSFAQIRAPFDGIMNRLEVRKGSLLDEGDLLTSLSDISQMWVYFNVPEAEYLDYKTNLIKDSNMKVGLEMANNKMFNQIGVVETIEADFNNETGNLAFRATFQNPDRLLRHGETGNVIVNVPFKDALIIPQKATFEVLNTKYVYVVDKDNVLKSREITISNEIPNLYVISKGLVEGDKILLEGLRLVSEDDKIEYDYKKPKDVIRDLNIHAE